MPLISLALALAAQVPDNPAPLNAPIVEFCRANLNNKVGRGECSDLADAALAKVGAGRRQAQEYPTKGDYVWGDLVYLLEYKGGNRNEVFITTGDRPRAGDIIQFRDVTARKTTYHPDGSSTWYESSYGHHTAVIASVNADGKVWKLYEQNSNERRYVVEGQLAPGDIKKGFVRVYRAKPAPTP